MQGDADLRRPHRHCREKNAFNRSRLAACRGANTASGQSRHTHGRAGHGSAGDYKVRILLAYATRDAGPSTADRRSAVRSGPRERGALIDERKVLTGRALDR